MISVILLVLTVILIAIGAVCGFRRGILKEGVRTVLWIVLFACSCFFIPQIADKLPLLVAERFEITAVDVEQIVAELIKRVEILRKETYLILPMAGFVRTLLVPFITIAFFWVSGFFSWLIYLIVALFLRGATENQKLGSKLAGLVLGLVLALFGGAVTIYPVAAASGAVREGDSRQTLCNEFDAAKMVATSYEGSVVKIVYQFTGTEWLSKSVHNIVNDSVTAEESHNIWVEFPEIIRLGAEGWQMYSAVTGKMSDTVSLKEQMERTVDAYFSLSFVSDENKIVLLKRLKNSVGASLGDEMSSKLLEWLPVQSREQVINDAMVYAGVYDILQREGILNAVLEGKNMPAMSEETGSAVINTLYELSNAEVVIPEFINLLYSFVMAGVEKELVQTENLIWDEQTKEEISSVISVLCTVSSVMDNVESLTIDDKKTVLDALKNLKDNRVVGNENYAALLKTIMGML